MEVSYFKNENGQNLAYAYYEGNENGSSLPTVMFLGGFRSDMSGTKALYLERKCRELGQAFIRFDYTGHGLSDGDFEDGTIGIWKDDARQIMDHVFQGDVVLVGSSMGGWISLLLLSERVARICGVVGIAAAPDFTQEIEGHLSEDQKRLLWSDGRIEVSNDYSDDPYVFTRRLIEDGRDHLLLDGSYNISVPLILLQGKLDADVPWEKALRIQRCFKGPDSRVVFVENGDHRLSKPDELDLIWNFVVELSGS